MAFANLAIPNGSTKEQAQAEWDLIVAYYGISWEVTPRATDWMRLGVLRDVLDRQEAK